MVCRPLYLPYNTNLMSPQPSTLEEALRAVPPCFPRACAIQSCLQRNGYNESKCGAEIDALYECCIEMYKHEGLAEKNVCCPKKPLLELKVKQRAAEKGTGAELMETRRR
ncbi:hypothetical protein FN846DRAFT_975990 [Sphaerosporella brunnea]|uniref:Cx9C motif-containing protein 4, mitochondrial n=1 Tax=Sphaerosporella brunnea TaxID=1250544 RepID=A0A5J5EG89_9PEZI|nr:hypothetical protein FN846DRAFT_975990 [Sphaerosporella brunnea]